MCCERDSGFSGHELMVLESEMHRLWESRVLALLVEIEAEGCECEGDEQCRSCSAGFLLAMKSVDQRRG